MPGKESDARRQQNPGALLVFAARASVIAFELKSPRVKLGGTQKKGPCAPLIV
jgi:hypothetical protein